MRRFRLQSRKNGPKQKFFMVLPPPWVQIHVLVPGTGAKLTCASQNSRSQPPAFAALATSRCTKSVTHRAASSCSFSARLALSRSVRATSATPRRAATSQSKPSKYAATEGAFGVTCVPSSRLKSRRPPSPVALSVKRAYRCIRDQGEVHSACHGRGHSSFVALPTKAHL